MRGIKSVDAELTHTRCRVEREVGDRRVRDRDLIKEAAAIRARETREGDSLSLIERTAVQEGVSQGRFGARERERVDAKQRPVKL